MGTVLSLLTKAINPANETQDSMEPTTIDWMSVSAATLAIAIFAGGLLMMFTDVWTQRKK